MLGNPWLVGFRDFVVQLIANKRFVTIGFALVSVIFIIASYVLSVRIFNKLDL